MLANKPIVVFIISLLLIIPHHFACCQESDELLIVEVKLWNSEGDTFPGYLYYIDQYNLQFSIVLTDSVGNSIKFYSPRDIEGFYFYLKQEKNIFHSVENPFGIGRAFLQLIYEGVYSVYLYLEMDQKSSLLTFIPHYYLWKEGWLEPEITPRYEVGALLKHFSNCPEVKYKIKTGEYGLRTISTLLEEYEKCVLTDEYEFFFE